MSITFRLASLTVAGRPVFTCDACGAHEAGMFQSLAVPPTDDPAHAAANLVRASSMPIGWSSYHANPRDIHKCPRCKP